MKPRRRNQRTSFSVAALQGVLGHGDSSGSGGDSGSALGRRDEAVAEGEIDRGGEHRGHEQCDRHHHGPRHGLAADQAAQQREQRAHGQEHADPAQAIDREGAEIPDAGDHAEEQALDRRDPVPVHQRRRMPEHQEQRGVQHQRQQSGEIQFALGGWLVARDQHGEPGRDQRAGGVDRAQQQHRARPLAAGPEGAEQHRGHGEAPLGRLLGRGHQAQGGGGHQQAADDHPDVRHLGHRDHRGHVQEEQPGQCQGLLDEGPDPQLDPQEAGAGGDDVEFH